MFKFKMTSFNKRSLLHLEIILPSPVLLIKVLLFLYLKRFKEEMFTLSI